jgi:hypothetical protein
MSADIDIDLPDRAQLLKLIKHVPARQQNRVHNSGIYVTQIPVDPITNWAAIDYVEAESRNYFKIDILNMNVYQLIRDPVHYEAMLARPPNWTKLWTNQNWAEKIVHVGNHTELLKSMKPDSIVRMAAFISIIRPGKMHLQNKPWAEVFNSVWDGDNSKGFIFKKSHSLGYAMLVTLHMNLLDDTLVNSSD